MIQIGSYLNIIDNSGAKKGFCIKILNSGYKQRYAYVGNLILISIKSIRFSKNIKVKKGEIHKALIIKTKSQNYLHSSNYYKCFENAIVLLNKQNKLIGTRIFGTISKSFKSTKFLKLATLSSGFFF